MHLPYFLRCCICIAALVLPLLPVSVRAEPPALAAGVRVLRDLPYVSDGHARQRLDLYLPAKAENAPLLIWIHGGGWEGGSKENCPAVGLVGQGYTVASLNYRLSQHAPFPAQIEDCKAAVRWLRAHAAEYGYNPACIGAWGASAGGHLVAMLGVTGEMKEFDVGENLEQSSAVKCVINWFGPADFLRFKELVGKERDRPGSLLARFFGGPFSEKTELARRASPVTWVTKTAAPMLILHGTKDALVPLSQSEVLAERLTAAGVEVTLEVLEGAPHGGPEFSTAEKRKLMNDFLKRHLQPS
ncbi:MAG: peptidase prolyl oligopeptidase active site domain protein [Chthoniobacter sp.]|nr:peptidase prolyl oligopeptidase active site domain protein [Chthoniobacter sp.]